MFDEHNCKTAHPWTKYCPIPESKGRKMMNKYELLDTLYKIDEDGNDLDVIIDVHEEGIEYNIDRVELKRDADNAPYIVIHASES